LEDRGLPVEGLLVGERLTKRDTKLVELRLVHHRDGPHDDEQGHQQRDHVRVGQEPALVARVAAVAVAAAPRPPPVRAHATPPPRRPRWPAWRRRSRARERPWPLRARWARESPGASPRACAGCRRPE